ncbi:hypothetical protein [Paenibacillus lautus]|uniref:hypothetical protein n=1 Tax=Paenibacillus lautus TaxID=1401 RepID=UPI003D2AB4E9
MNIRTETKHDYEKVQNLLIQAFPGQEEALLVQRLREDKAFQRELAIRRIIPVTALCRPEPMGST